MSILSCLCPEVKEISAKVGRFGTSQQRRFVGSLGTLAACIQQI
jgi:hypothetical protein